MWNFSYILFYSIIIIIIIVAVVLKKCCCNIEKEGIVAAKVK